MTFLDRLGDPVRIRRQLDRLAANRRRTGIRLSGNGDPSLARLLFRAPELARRLGRDIRHGAYRPAPARIRPAELDKLRDLCVFRPADLIVQGVLAGLLSEAMEPLLPARLFSYRRRRSSWMAVRDFASYVREHRRANPDPQSRGLFVLRADVRDYGESIPMDERSAIWTQVGRMLGLSANDDAWPLVRELVRPAILTGEGAVIRPERGVATGSPVATALTNLYLTGLDRHLQEIAGGFYARYGDDFLFAHTDPEVAREARRLATRYLEEHGLELNREKCRLLHFNGAGRPGPEGSGLPGSSRVTYLGCNISFRGTVGLSEPKRRETLREIRRRVQRTAEVVALREPDEQGRLLCATVDTALDPRVETSVPASAVLAAAVTDRRQLKDLDFRIARTIAEALAGRHGSRSFRRYPYRKLRAEWGLTSLVVQRNRGRVSARSAEKGAA
jgi:hypothetical protein